MDRSDCAGNGVVSLVAANAWRTLKDAHYLEAGGGLCGGSCRLIGWVGLTSEKGELERNHWLSFALVCD